MRFKISFFLFILVLSIYSATQGGRIHISDEMHYYYMTLSLAEKGSFCLPNDIGRQINADYIKNCYYSYFAPGMSIAAVPFYIFSKYILPEDFIKIMVIETNAFLGALIVVIFFNFSFRLSRSYRRSFFISIILAFSTLNWYYSTLFFFRDSMFTTSYFKSLLYLYF